MPESPSMSEECFATAPLIGARLGLAALHRVLEAHRAWLERRPGGLRASLNGVVLAEAALDKVNLERAYLKSANFIDARMSGANLSGAILHFADLSNATLIDADLSQAELVDAKLEHALLAGANLSEARLLRASLRRANLREAHLLAVVYKIPGRLRGKPWLLRYLRGGRVYDLTRRRGVAL